MSLKMNAKQLRDFKLGKKKLKLPKNEIYIILDDVLDTYNIGSVFRLADAVAARKLYLCGGTETPPNSRIMKASINTTEVVEWEYANSAKEAISKLRSQVPSVQIVSIEQTQNSVPFDQFEYHSPICLIVGNESYGVSQEALDLSDAVVELPMFGVNISLNVMVTLGIVLYTAMSKLDLNRKFLLP